MPIETINIVAMIRNTTEAITQTGHGFTEGDVVRFDNATPNTFTKAQADTADNAKAVGVVTEVLNANDFVVTYSGRIISGVPAFPEGTVMYLSDTVAGAMTATAPAIEVRILEVSESALSAVVNIDWSGTPGGAVQSVTGDSVDNTDPANPVVNAWPLAGTGTDLANGKIVIDPAFSGEILEQDNGFSGFLQLRFLGGSDLEMRHVSAGGSESTVNVSLADEAYISFTDGVDTANYVCGRNTFSDAVTYPVVNFINQKRFNFNGVAAPTVTDDNNIGYAVNSLWIYDGVIYICTDASTGAAVWSALGGDFIPLAGTNPSDPVTGDIEIDSTGTRKIFQTDGGTGEASQRFINGNEATIVVGDTSGVFGYFTVRADDHEFGSNDPTYPGATYNQDYSANYTNRSLVDKEYVDNSAGPAIVSLTRAALQALIAGSTLDTTVTYRVTDATVADIVIDVWAATINTLQSAMIDQTNTRFGFYNIVGDTFTEVYIPAIASVAQGDVIYHNGTSWVRLPAGTSSNVLRTGGSGQNPSWARPIPCVDAGGTADAITADYTPNVTLADNLIVAVVAGAANATATPTFAPDGLTAHTIVKWGGQPLIAGDIAGAEFVAMLRYDLGNTRWELLNPAGNQGWIDWSASSNPQGGSSITTNNFRYRPAGYKKIECIVNIRIVSNSTTFTIDLPVAAANTFVQFIPARILNNGTSASGYGQTDVNSITFSVKRADGGDPANTGNKEFSANFFYETI